jgi:hypothetical protein
VDPVITAQRFTIPAAHIPQHNVAPSITRIVRLQRSLTSGASSITFDFADLANQDGLDYLGVASPRYNTMRVISAKIWGESPPGLSVSQQTYGLIVTELTSGFTISDRPTTGARLNAIGLRFPFNVRNSINSTSSGVSILIVASDPVPAASTVFPITVDFNVELYS